MEVLTTLIGGVLILVSFIWWESRAAAPLLPLRLFRNRSFSAANVVGVIFCFGIFGVIFLLIQFLQVVQGASPLEAGLMTMPWTLAPLVISPITGIFTPKIGTRPIIVTGLILTGLGLFWVGTLLNPDTPYIQLVAPFLVSGIGNGIVFAPLATATLQGMAAEDQATASGTNATARQIGVALGVATLTAIFTSLGGTLTPSGFSDAATPTTFVGAAALVAAVIAGLFLPKHVRAEEKVQS